MVLQSEETKVKGCTGWWAYCYVLTCEKMPHWEVCETASGGWARFITTLYKMTFIHSQTQSANNLITLLQRSHLLTTLHCGLSFQHMDFGGHTQTISVIRCLTIWQSEIFCHAFDFGEHTFLFAALRLQILRAIPSLIFSRLILLLWK